MFSKSIFVLILPIRVSHILLHVLSKREKYSNKTSLVTLLYYLSIVHPDFTCQKVPQKSFKVLFVPLQRKLHSLFVLSQCRLRKKVVKNSKQEVGEKIKQILKRIQTYSYLGFSKGSVQAGIILFGNYDIAFQQSRTYHSNSLDDIFLQLNLRANQYLFSQDKSLLILVFRS